MTHINCRQCGHRSERKDFPTGEFRCPWCDWREALQSGPMATAVAAEATKATEPPPVDVLNTPTPAPAPTLDGDAADDLERLRELTQREFALWCGRLFERFGYVVRIVEESEQSDCDLRITRNEVITVVDCKTCEEGRSVTRAECQTLIGAMVGSQVTRGMILATGAFDPACEEYARGLKGLELQLVDGNELIETYQALRTPPLSKWFDLTV
jgi:hypothetical protein